MLSTAQILCSVFRTVSKSYCRDTDINPGQWKNTKAKWDKIQARLQWPAQQDRLGYLCSLLLSLDVPSPARQEPAPLQRGETSDSSHCRKGKRASASCVQGTKKDQLCSADWVCHRSVVARGRRNVCFPGTRSRTNKAAFTNRMLPAPKRALQHENKQRSQTQQQHAVWGTERSAAEQRRAGREELPQLPGTKQPARPTALPGSCAQPHTSMIWAPVPHSRAWEELSLPPAAEGFWTLHPQRQLVWSQSLA